MKRWLRRLGIGLALLVAAGLALGLFISWRVPMLAGNLLLGSYNSLPLYVQKRPVTWKIARQLLLWQQTDEVPLDVEKHRDGRFARDADMLVVAFGDSTTAGFMIDDIQAWPYLLQERMRRRSRKLVRVLNAGVPGETAPHGADRFRRDALDLAPDWIILGYLINDGRIFGENPAGQPRIMVDNEPFYEAFDEMLTGANEAGVPVTVHSTNPIGMRYFRGKPNHWPLKQAVLFERRIRGLEKLAGRRNARFVDTYAALEQREDLGEMYQLDGIHLDARGHRVMADLLYEHWLATMAASR